MPRFLSPIYVKQEIVTGNETISGNETIFGVTSGKNSYWTTVNSELSVSSNFGSFNSLSSIQLSAFNVIANKFFGDGSNLTGISGFSGSNLDSTKLPLSGGNMSGPITFGPYTYSPRIDQGHYDANRGGLSGLSLICSVDYDFNWQAGWITALEQDRLTPRPLYIDSGAGTSVKIWNNIDNKGINISHTGITYPDGSTQTTAYTIDWMTLVRGYNTTPTLLATISSGEVYTYVYTSSPSNITYYRFISTDGSTDIFYTYFSGTTLSGVVASKSIIL